MVITSLPPLICHNSWTASCLYRSGPLSGLDGRRIELTHFSRPLKNALSGRLAAVCFKQEQPKDSSIPIPGYPTVGIQVLNVDHLLLRQVDLEPRGNSSLRLQRQAFHVTGPGAGLLRPAVNATYGPLAIEAPIQPDLLLHGRQILPVLLARQVRSSAPVIRVLFHMPAGSDVGAAAASWPGEAESAGGAKAAPGRTGTSSVQEEEAHCVTAYAFWETREVRGACMVVPGGFCVAQLKPEPAWFSPATRPPGSSIKEAGEEAGKGAQQQGNPAEVYFQSRRDQTGQCVPQDSLKRVGMARGGGQPKSGTPMRRIGSVSLLRASTGNPTFFRLRLGGAVVVQTSSRPLKTNDVATFYVFLSSVSALESFTLRATVRKGLSFSAARPSDSALWDIVLEPGRGANPSTMSVLCQRKAATTGKRGLLEVLQLDFETKDISEQADSQMITWRLELPGNVKDVGTMKIFTSKKDYVGLAPLVMSSDVLNTATLTAKMVSVPVRTLAVESDGTVTDVTNYTSCRSTDPEALKVSERCDYVFVNGKETRGRSRMLLNFTYSYLSAQLEMSVWMPRLPLLIDVADPELSQIKGWRVPVAAGNRRSTWDSEEEEEMRKGRGCMLQYQQSLVRVLTPFVAQPPSWEPPGGPGPAEYFLGPDWQVDVTRLVRYALRVGDTEVARLQGGVLLQGRSVGTTTLQVLSPLSSSVLAERTIRVLDDKVSVTELGVQLVSGLSLSLQLSPGSNKAIVATATTQEVMASLKQEALVSGWVQFSDGAVTPLEQFDRSAYSLTVVSQDQGVASVRRTPQWAFVVAQGEGQGPLVRVELRICEQCQKSKRKSKLAVGAGYLRVSLQAGSKPGGAGKGPSTGPGTGDAGNRRSFWSTVPQSAETSTARATSSSRSPRPIPTASSARGGSATARGFTKVIRSTTTAIPTSTTGTAAAGTMPQGTGRLGVDNILGGLGKGDWQGRGYGNMLDSPNSVQLPKKETPKADPKKEPPAKPKPPRLIESDLIRKFRAMSDLEIGMYALAGVSCVAILAFLLNCASYKLCFRGRKTPVQAGGPADPRDPKQQQPDHKHDWVWLGSTAAGPDHGGSPAQGSTLKREAHPRGLTSHGSLDGHHRGLEASLSAVTAVPERTATLGRRSSSQTAMAGAATRALDPMAQRSATLLAPRHRAEPLHSPTSKRNQVQFTTFTTLDIKHLAALRKNGVDFNWASQQQQQQQQQTAAPTEPQVPLPDMPWPVVKPLGAPQ
ncbi:transmembrane protein 132D [Aplochiton taeniatus]